MYRKNIESRNILIISLIISLYQQNIPYSAEFPAREIIKNFNNLIANTFVLTIIKEK